MKSWILTGGVATGKSSVLSHLGRFFTAGLRLFSSDEAVAASFADPGVGKLLTEAFGRQVWLGETGAAGGTKVNRSWIREQILPDPKKKARLEAVIHPFVLSALESARKQAEEDGMNLFVAEVPLHYEIGGLVSADLIIVVAASRSVQVRRMMENRGLDEHAVHTFLNAQWPIEAKAERADVVIWNDGDIPALEAQVLLLASHPRQP